MRVTAGSLVAAGALLLGASAASAQPLPSPSASPTASPTPSPAVALHAVLSGSLAFTNGVNATGSFDTPTGADRATRVNVSNAFIIVSKTAGTLQYGLQAGAYSLPVVGFAGNKTIQTGANTDLYGPLPLAYLEYAPNSSFNISAGVLATLTGAESTYTYLNWNIQRGAVWSVENAVSRGFRAAWTTGKLSATLGANDGFYSGRYGAAEGSLTFAFDPNDSALFVALIPNSQTPPNPSAPVANKELLNLVLTRTRGNLQLAPYVLYAKSPAASALGYKGPEAALGAAALGDLAVGGRYSVALRYETLHNASTVNDTSKNADLIGYGPGSGVNTWTITPAWHSGTTFARVDFSKVRVTSAAPGLAFGTGGTSPDQTRVVLELGVQY